MKPRVAPTALLLFFALSACGGRLALAPGAAGMAPLTETVLEEYPRGRPPWLETVPPATPDALFFVGSSASFSTEPEARDDALRAAVREFARYCGVDVRVLAESLRVGVAPASGVRDPTVAESIAEKQTVEAFVRRVKGNEWYVRRIQRSRDGVPVDSGWQASVLVKVPPDEVTRVERYRSEAREQELERDLGAVLEPYGRAVRLSDAARAARAAGRPFDALSAYLDALALYDAATGDGRFSEARPLLRARGWEVPLPLEAEAARLLSEVRLEPEHPTRRVPAGQGLTEPLTVRAVWGDLPLAGVPVVFSGRGVEIRTSTSAEGRALFLPEDSPRWSEGNHTFQARLAHPALERAGGRFPEPPPASFVVSVEPLPEEEARARNATALAALADRLASRAEAANVSPRIGSVAVLPASEQGAASRLGALLGRELVAALARRTRIPVLDAGSLVDVRSALRVGEVAGPAGDARRATATPRGGAVVVSEVSRSGPRAHLSSRLLQVGTGLLLAAGDADLYVLRVWQEPRGEALPPLPVLAGPGGSTGLEKRFYYGPRGSARVDYGAGVIEATALGTADMRRMTNGVQAEEVARRTARHLAYEILAEAAGKLQIDARTQYEDAVTAVDGLRVEAHALLQGATVVSESFEWVDDPVSGAKAPRASVTVRLPVEGAGGLARLVDKYLPPGASAAEGSARRQPGGPAPPAAPAPPAPPAAPAPPLVAGRAAPVTRFDGLIVVAAGLDTGYEPALRPQVRGENGTVLYGPESVRPEAVLAAGGYVRYAPTLEAARAALAASARPLTVQALSSPRKGELVLSDADARAVLEADRAERFLARGRVAVVVP